GVTADADKLRIVEARFCGPRLVSATARAHGISRSLLRTWRRLAREGKLGVPLAPSFAPGMLAPAGGSENQPGIQRGADRDRAGERAADHRRSRDRCGSARAGDRGAGAGMIVFPPAGGGGLLTCPHLVARIKSDAWWAWWPWLVAG
ncbi:hypothetical protein CNY89_23035, partial [Amaricoccus sp. HAR-UPW-R2A-40]